MTDQSARIGTPPQTPNDALVRRGLILLCPSELNPVRGQPFGSPRPPGYIFQSWSWSLQIGTAFALFFVLAFTTARLLTRGLYKRQLGLDDLAIVPAAMGCVVYLSSIIIQTSAGCLGKHIWDCTYQEMGMFFTWAQVNDPIFYFTVFAVKLSIALQNRRMTHMSSRQWKFVHWAFISLFVVLTPLLTFIEIFKCSPTRINYSLQALASVPDPRSIKCLNWKAMALADRILHIATDCALLCVPITIVWGLQMPWRRKARLIAIFAVGGMSTIASIYRNVLISRDYDDITWQSRTIYVWDIIDISFACVVANLPALNAIVDVLINRIKSYASSDNGSKDRVFHGPREQLPGKLTNFANRKGSWSESNETSLQEQKNHFSRSWDLAFHDSSHALTNMESNNAL